MKKRILVLISILALICFCSCGGESESSANNSHSSDLSANMSDTSDLSAETDNNSHSAANDASESKESESSDAFENESDASGEASEDALDIIENSGDYFEITLENGIYCFYTDEMRGSYKTDFSIVQDDTPTLSSLVLKDGRNIELNYGEIVFDEEEQIYKTEINGFTFWIEEFHDSEGRLCQVLECIEKTERSIFVLFYPELDYGTVEIYFDFVADGNKYTLNYADGQTAEKIINYDSESGEYYFG